MRVDYEDGSEQCVGNNRKTARIQCNAVAPLHEVVVRSGQGGKRCGGEVVEAATSRDNTGRCGVGGSGHQIVVDCKLGGIACVFGDDNGARIVGVAVIPLHKMVAIIWSGGDDSSCVVVVDSAAGHGAIGAVSADYGEGVGVEVELCGIGGIGSHGDKAGIIGDAVHPLHEVIAMIGHSGDVDGSVVGIGAPA